MVKNTSPSVPFHTCLSQPPTPINDRSSGRSALKNELAPIAFPTMPPMNKSTALNPQSVPKIGT